MGDEGCVTERVMEAAGLADLGTVYVPCCPYWPPRLASYRRCMW